MPVFIKEIDGEERITFQTNYNLPSALLETTKRKIRQAFDEGLRVGEIIGKRIGEEEAKKKQISFSDYYMERLEYWRKAFDKKPEPYRLIIKTVDETLVENFATAECAQKRINQLSRDMDEGRSITAGGQVLGNHHVCRIWIGEGGHPEPYTPEEIEAWAKEKVEAEMKGWKVVKSDHPFGLDAFIRAAGEAPWFIGTKRLGE